MSSNNSTSHSKTVLKFKPTIVQGESGNSTSDILAMEVARNTAYNQAFNFYV